MFRGADPRFLERGFICIKVSLCRFYLIFSKYPMKSETKLFHFHRIFKNGGGGGGLGMEA